MNLGATSIGKFLVGLAIVLSSSCSQAESKLTIATAANMQYAMLELSKSFEKNTGIKSELVVGSSGRLLAQLTAQAPYDMFFSADLLYPKVLADANLTTGPPEIYAYGRLVLWTNKPNKMVSMGNLLAEEKIAMGNPAVAPYGKAAEEVLEYFEIKSILRDKMVFGESISQVNQFVTTQNVSVGFTSKSSVIANKGFTGNWAQIPDSLYTPIAQAMVILNESKQKKAACQFAEFVKSAKGREILNRFGYSTTDL